MCVYICVYVYLYMQIHLQIDFLCVQIYVCTFCIYGPRINKERELNLTFFIVGYTKIKIIYRYLFFIFHTKYVHCVYVCFLGKYVKNKNTRCFIIIVNVIMMRESWWYSVKKYMCDEIFSFYIFFFIKNLYMIYMAYFFYFILAYFSIYDIYHGN